MKCILYSIVKQVVGIHFLRTDLQQQVLYSYVFIAILLYIRGCGLLNFVKTFAWPKHNRYWKFTSGNEPKKRKI